MVRRLLAAFAMILLLSSCEMVDRQTVAVPVAGPASLETVQPTARSVALPFENRFPNRWNSSNDGSPYEPCVAFSGSELLRFKIDPDVIEDAALVDGQGIRGCSWTMPETFSFSNLVTNSRSLDVYRAGTTENNWLPDIGIGEHNVGVFALNLGRSHGCSTYVQSYSAGVIFSIVTSTSNEGQKIHACKLVEDVTRAYIDKIPG